MLNGTIGVQRLLARLRTETTPAAPASRLRSRSVRAAIRPAIAPERALPLAVAAILAGTAFVSYMPSGQGPVGGPTGDGPAPRIVVGGAFGAALDGEVQDLAGAGSEAAYVGRLESVTPVDGQFVPVELPEPTAYELRGPFLEDGTVLAGVAPDTSIPDGTGVLRTYKVQVGDTLTGIANKHGVSMMTVWWANSLTAKDDLRVGQVLTIPTVSGLIVTVTDTDTIESLALRHKVTTQAIVEANELEQPVLIVGQRLVIPGALGEAIATPTPTPKPTARPRTSSGGSVSSPSTYSGGAFVWPVVGGGNYISQYFRYGHYGIDIAADRGSTVRAAAAGKVIFAGWKSNGGGYQVWLAHGSNLYTTYNHMSGVSVGRGQSVSRGQRVGRIGCTGYCSGPHLHFEVWKGAVWNGGSRVNPLRYY